MRNLVAVLALFFSSIAFSATESVESIPMINLSAPISCAISLMPSRPNFPLLAVNESGITLLRSLQKVRIRRVGLLDVVIRIKCFALR